MNQKSQRRRALDEALSYGKRAQTEAMARYANRLKGTEHEGYVSRSDLKVNEALANVTSDYTDEQIEGVLTTLWCVAVHGWASEPTHLQWRLYVAGLIGQRGELSWR